MSERVRTYPEMDAQIVGIMRQGNGFCLYAAQRIEELEARLQAAEAERDALRATVERMQAHMRDLERGADAFIADIARLVAERDAAREALREYVLDAEAISQESNARRCVWCHGVSTHAVKCPVRVITEVTTRLDALRQEGE